MNLVQSLEVFSTTNATISWDTPVSDGGSSIIEYEIYWEDTTSNSGFTGISTTNNYTQTDLTEGALYYVTVKSKNIIGEGTGTVTFV